MTDTSHFDTKRLSAKEAWEEVERIGKMLDKQDWYQDCKAKDIEAAHKLAEELNIRSEVENLTKEEMARILEKLESGRYIGPLETHTINWSLVKIIRDIFQNFFDGMGEYSGVPTLHGTEIKITKKEEDGAKVVEFYITSPAEYDFRYLLHHGGTTKLDSPELAGGFGEGIKIASFLLIKQGYLDKVTMGSDHWQAEYYLDALPKEEYPRPVRGLHMRAQFQEEPIPGNFVKFSIPEEGAEEIVEVVKKMKYFFLDPENPDYKEPTYENVVGGFKLLPKGEKGNLYIAGQRHEYDDDEGWENELEGMHLWCKTKMLEQRRDRTYANEYEIESRIIRPLIGSMDTGSLKRVFHLLEPYYSSRDNAIPEYLLDEVAKKLFDRLPAEEKKGIEYELAGTYISKGGHDEDQYEKMLIDQGFKICRDSLKDFGILTAKARVTQLAEKAKRVEISEAESARLKILENFGRIITEMAQKRSITELAARLGVNIIKKDSGDYLAPTAFHKIYSYFRRYSVPPLEVCESPRIRIGQNEIAIHGFTSVGEHITIDIKIIHAGFVQGINTYLHELTHNITLDPNDFSKDFVKVNNMLTAMVLAKTLESPEKIAKLKDKWDKLSKEIKSEE